MSEKENDSQGPTDSSSAEPTMKSADPGAGGTAQGNADTATDQGNNATDTANAVPSQGGTTLAVGSHTADAGSATGGDDSGTTATQNAETAVAGSSADSGGNSSPGERDNSTSLPGFTPEQTEQHRELLSQISSARLLLYQSAEGLQQLVLEMSRAREDVNSKIVEVKRHLEKLGDRNSHGALDSILNFLKEDQNNQLVKELPEKIRSLHDKIEALNSSLSQTIGNKEKFDKLDQMAQIFRRAITLNSSTMASGRSNENGGSDQVLRVGLALNELSRHLGFPPSFDSQDATSREGRGVANTGAAQGAPTSKDASIGIRGELNALQNTLTDPLKQLSKMQNVLSTEGGNTAPNLPRSIQAIQEVLGGNREVSIGARLEEVAEESSKISTEVVPKLGGIHEVLQTTISPKVEKVNSALGTEVVPKLSALDATLKRIDITVSPPGGKGMAYLHESAQRIDTAVANIEQRLVPRWGQLLVGGLFFVLVLIVVLGTAGYRSVISEQRLHQSELARCQSALEKTVNDLAVNSASVKLLSEVKELQAALPSRISERWSNYNICRKTPLAECSMDCWTSSSKVYYACCQGQSHATPGNTEKTKRTE